MTAYFSHDTNDFRKIERLADISHGSNAKPLGLDGATVHILSLDDLILNKKAVNRAADLSYAEELEKIRNNKRKKDR